ncbi:hypothetical protein HDU98_003186 [Podochytrium sp. JEL0797]|nr:hypothetical protein HDU98_003186 [Podochytrium sp. JEL0797]
MLSVTRFATRAVLRPASRINTRSLSYFRANPKPSSGSSPKPVPKQGEPVYEQPPLKDPMAGFTEQEVKDIKRDIDEQGKRAYSIGYGIMGGGMAVVFAVVYMHKNGMM